MKYIITLLLISTALPQGVLAQEIGGDPVIAHDVIEFEEIPVTISNPLSEALSLTYSNNPSIQSARNNFLAAKEQIPQAKSGLLPQISADADITYTDTETQGDNFFSSDGGNAAKSASLNLNQSIYKGGTLSAEIAQAQYNVKSQEFVLSHLEQSTLFSAVQAYMTLHQNQAIVKLRDNNLSLVRRELEQAQARFDVGELTRTDVSQSEARLADANANYILAQADVKSAIANFRAIVGAPPPSNMDYPILTFDMPKTLDAAIELSQTNNRDLLQAYFAQQAAAAQVSAVKGERLPQVSAIGRLNKTYDQSDFIEEQRQASIGLSASVPLYTGGATQSRISQATKTQLAARQQFKVTRNAAREATIQNWSSWQAAKATTLARRSQIEAAKIALEGVQYETEFGERTTLDSLNANQELLTAEVALVESRQREIVAQYALALTLGLLVPQNLGFSEINPQ